MDNNISRHASLVTRGAKLPFLNGEWTRSSEQPYVFGKPHYLKHLHHHQRLHQPPTLGAADNFNIPEALHVYHDGQSWRITSVDGATLFAIAHSDAEHPNTVAQDSWRLASPESARLEPCTDFQIVTEGPNTEHEPFLLEEIGIDFFLRVQLKSRKVIWFEDPITGSVFHSAAKSSGAAGGRTQPGKRFCHVCRKCISANNFHSQHLANLHRPGAPLGVRATPDGAGRIRLLWAPPHSDGGLPLVSYRISVSFDNCKSWCHDLDVNLDQTEANPKTHPNATVSLEQLAAVAPTSSAHDAEVSFAFQVTAVNRAGAGTPSEITSRLTADQIALAPLNPMPEVAAHPDSYADRAANSQWLTELADVGQLNGFQHADSLGSMKSADAPLDDEPDNAYDRSVRMSTGSALEPLGCDAERMTTTSTGRGSVRSITSIADRLTRGGSLSEMDFDSMLADEGDMHIDVRELLSLAMQKSGGWSKVGLPFWKAISAFNESLAAKRTEAAEAPTVIASALAVEPVQSSSQPPPSPAAQLVPLARELTV